MVATGEVDVGEVVVVGPGDDRRKGLLLLDTGLFALHLHVTADRLISPGTHALLVLYPRCRWACGLVTLTSTWSGEELFTPLLGYAAGGVLIV